MSWVSVGVTVAGTAAKLITAHKQKKEGNRLINTPMPKYAIPTEITEAAQQGLPSEQYAKAQKDINRNMITALSSANDRRGGLSSIAKIQQISNDAALNLNVKDAQAKQQNQRVLAGYKDKQYQINDLNPYNRNYNYGMQVLGAGNANTVSGIDTLLGGIGDASYMGAFSGLGSGGQRRSNVNAVVSNRPRTGLNYIPLDEQIPQ